MNFWTYILSIAVSAALAGYLLYKRDFQFHTLVVLILTVPYITGGIPQWFANYTGEVRNMLILLHAPLLGRAIHIYYPKYSRLIGGIALLAFFVWRVSVHYLR